jgi:hypothetical protein
MYAKRVHFPARFAAEAHDTYDNIDCSLESGMSTSSIGIFKVLTTEE